MPLSVLVVIVAFGLAVVIGAVHFFGGKRPGKLDEQSARAIWLSDFANDTISGVVVSSDRTTALIELQEDNAVGLVRQMGAHHIVRRLEVGSVGSVAETGEGLDVKLNETTLPRFMFLMSDGQNRVGVAAMFETLVEERGWTNA